MSSLLQNTMRLAGVAALLSACGTVPAGNGSPTAPPPAAALALPGATSTHVKVAEASASYGAWARASYGAWARATDDLWASTLPGGLRNTFAENLADWEAIHLAAGQAQAPHLGEGVMVAVVDTGLDLGHPAFADHLADAAHWRDFIGNDAVPQEEDGGTVSGHGTAVAGLILQVAPGATILPLRALKASGETPADTVAAAVRHAVASGADIINVSAVSGYDSTLTEAIREAAEQGVYVTLPTGNDGTRYVQYPARSSTQNTTLGQYAINAGAIRSDYTLTPWTNYGGNLEVLAPGDDLVTAGLNGTVVAVKGTSFAAPVLAGALALALGEAYSGDDRGRLAQQLGATATSVAPNNPNLAAGGSALLGQGAINVGAFLKSVR